jgi:hypothetical protein
MASSTGARTVSSRGACADCLCLCLLLLLKWLTTLRASVRRHAYSLIRVAEVPLGDGESVRLLELRNPFGNQLEWTGAWGDTSELWKTHPGVGKAVGFSPRADGLFWMAWADFSASFNQVEVCLKEMPSKRAQFGEQTETGHKGVAGQASGAEATAPAKRKQTAQRPLLPRAGTRLLHPTITIDPVPAQPDAPFAQYLASCMSYREACEKAEREQDTKSVG